MRRGHVPIRHCIGCRTCRPKEEMIRLKTDGEKVFVSDRKDRTPGRGCYVCRRKECIETALKKGRLERAFRINKMVYPTTEELLTRLEKKG
jgi:predicted RNA-binding protein YlxR (DUF448 family)